MGNAGGSALKRHWDLVQKYPSYQGGFIWDFADQALTGNGERVTGSGMSNDTVATATSPSSKGYSIRFLPAKPEGWKKGRICGLLLRGNIVLEELSWSGNDWVARLRMSDGLARNVSGKGDTTWTW